MASLRYLYRNRKHHPFGSRSFFKSWAKRILSLKELFHRNHRRQNLVKKGAKIAETAEIGKLLIEGKVKNLSIGDQSFLGEIKVTLYSEILIGKNVCINDGAILLTGSHDVLDSYWQHLKKPITINDYVWIGTNALILPGVRIGFGAVIGAGSVVTKDVPDRAIVVGNPAKVIERKRVEKLMYSPCEFLAANLAWLT